MNVIYQNARDLVVSLLTDPRLSDDDFLYLDDDPLKPPPEGGFTYIEDINTGKDYDCILVFD